MEKRDGHIHSPYCPHGTNDSFEEYINKALEMGLKEITFTEHLPLPKLNCDYQYIDDCAMRAEDTDKYIKDVEDLKIKYKDIIKINLGFEVDYVEGFEKEITEMLNKYKDHIDDAILSVHFVKYNGKDLAIDDADYLKVLINETGGIEKVYDLYFETVLKSINADLGEGKPHRIGHPTLIRRYNQKFPCEYKNNQLLEKIVKTIKEKDYEVDINTAGLRKEGCGEIYPSGYFKELVEKYQVRKVFGSDSHTASDVGRDFDLYYFK